jgi:hypothetical protein
MQPPQHGFIRSQRGGEVHQALLVAEKFQHLPILQRPLTRSAPSALTSFLPGTTGIPLAVYF